MNDKAEKYPNIGELLSFFGQDWKLMFEWENLVPDYQSALRKLKLDSEPTSIDKSIFELKKILNSRYDEEKLRDLITKDFGSAFYPSGLDMTYQKWLENVRDILEEPINQSKQYNLPKFVGE